MLNVAVVDKLIRVVKPICASEKGVRAVLSSSSPENTIDLTDTAPSLILQVIITAYLIIQ